MTLAVIDTRTGRVTCACAGSEPPLILRSGAGTASMVEAVNACNVALGVDAKQVYRPVEFRLEAEDALLLVTDGITEARRVNADGRREFLGY